MKSKLKHDLGNIHTSLRVAYELLASLAPSKAIELFALGLDRLKEVATELENPVTAEAIIQKLKLEPLCGEGGFYRSTYLRPASEKHASSSAIYYLVTAETFSALHALKEDEMFHFYAGDPVEMLQIAEGKKHTIVLGQNILKNESPQVLVKAGVWQGTKLVNGGKWALLGTTMSPAYRQDDFTLGERAKLIELYPHYEAEITAFTR